MWPKQRQGFHHSSIRIAASGMLIQFEIPPGVATQNGVAEFVDEHDTLDAYSTSGEQTSRVLPLNLLHERRNLFLRETVLQTGSQLSNDTRGRMRCQMAGLFPAHPVRDPVQ